jgi:hypothetical protein
MPQMAARLSFVYVLAGDADSVGGVEILLSDGVLHRLDGDYEGTAGGDCQFGLPLLAGGSLCCCQFGGRSGHRCSGHSDSLLQPQLPVSHAESLIDMFHHLESHIYVFIISLPKSISNVLML